MHYYTWPELFCHIERKCLPETTINQDNEFEMTIFEENCVSATAHRSVSQNFSKQIRKEHVYDLYRNCAGLFGQMDKKKNNQTVDTIACVPLT